MSIPKTSPQVLGFRVIKAYGSPVACFTAAGWWLLSNHTLLKEFPNRGFPLICGISIGRFGYSYMGRYSLIIFGNGRDVFIKK